VIDAEVKRILTEAHDKVREILATYRPALEELAQLLLKKEVVERPELQAILKVVKIDEAREKRKSVAPVGGSEAGSKDGRD
jgi:ATP-dependent Zn protease